MLDIRILIAFLLVWYVHVNDVLVTYCTHRVIMYSIETKATSRLPYFGHPPFNTYLSVACLVAVATELGGIKILYIHLGRFFSSKKCKLCIILGLLNVVLAINITLTTAR